MALLDVAEGASSAASREDGGAGNSKAAGADGLVHSEAGFTTSSGIVPTRFLVSQQGSKALNGAPLCCKHTLQEGWMGEWEETNTPGWKLRTPSKQVRTADVDKAMFYWI